MRTHPLALAQQTLPVAGTAATSTAEGLYVAFIIDESLLPQFTESPLHAGAETTAQRRYGRYVHRTDIPTAAAGFQAAVDRELNPRIL